MPEVSEFTRDQRERLRKAATLVASVANELNVTTHPCPTCGCNVSEDLNARYTHPQLIAMSRKLAYMGKDPSERAKIADKRRARP